MQKWISFALIFVLDIITAPIKENRMLYRKLMGFVLFQLVISSINAQVDYNYIPYRKGSKWGFCDSTKRVIIEPVFDRVSHFTTYKQYQPALKLAKVNMASGQGLLDTTGQLLISCNYTSFNFSSDYILLYNDTAQFMYTIADGSIKKVGTLGDVMPLEEVEIFATHNKIERIGRKEIKITRYSPDFSGEKERYITSSIILKADTAIFSYSTDTIFRVGRNNKWGYASFSEGIFLDPVYDTAIELNKGKAYAFKKGEDWYGHKRNSGKANPYWLGNSHLKMISGSYQYFTTLRGGEIRRIEYGI